MMLSSRSVSPSRRVRRTSRPPQLGHSGTLGMLRDCGEGPRSRNEPNALSFRGDLRIGRADADSENMTPEIARDLYGLTIPATSTVPRSVAGRSHRCQACVPRLARFPSRAPRTAPRVWPGETRASRSRAASSRLRSPSGTAGSPLDLEVERRADVTERRRPLAVVVNDLEMAGQ